MNYQWASASHRGRVRNNNEDSHWPEASGRGPGPVVVMVADGMGGAVGGEIASQLAVETAAELAGSPLDRVEKANAAVFHRAKEEPSLSGMGTTMTLIELNPGGLATIAHVGDSRAYLWHGGQLSPITNDHTVVAEYLAVGRISEEDVASHPHRNMLTRVLGLSADIEVDVSQINLEPGDRLLLCSDGLTNMVSEDAIAGYVGEGSPEEVAWTLIEHANRAGGHDNITVMVVAVES